MILGTDLDPAPRRQRLCDRGETVGAAVRVDIETEMGQVDRQPGVTGQRREVVGQPEIVLGRLIPDARVIAQLTGLVVNGCWPPAGSWSAVIASHAPVPGPERGAG
ncbi:hypothetical protein, partial [Nocardia farcinica]|uniref:hypothetical protein n=1 Tax=Nocardia farcinica TaxID=37329 RepID=UPI00245909E3